MQLAVERAPLTTEDASRRTRRKRIWVLAVPVVLVAASIVGWTMYQGQFTTLSGFVLDAERGTPVVGAIVRIGSESDSTGPDGRFDLGKQREDFEFTVSHASYLDWSGRIGEEIDLIPHVSYRYQVCSDRLQRPLRAYRLVDSRLDKGVNQAELDRLVEDAGDELSIAATNLEDVCDNVVASLEAAGGAYGSSVFRWGKCIRDFFCELDDIDPQLQRWWLRASRAIEAAEERLDGLKEPDLIGSGGPTNSV